MELEFYENIYTNFTEKDGFSFNRNMKGVSVNLMKNYIFSISITKNTIYTDNNFIYDFLPLVTNHFFTTEIDIF